MTEPATSSSPGVRTLALMSIPAVLVGIGSALILWLLDEGSDFLETVLWQWLPDSTGIDPDSGWWIFTVLTVTGIAVGLSAWLLPGHGGPDSATTELVEAPLKLRTLPSLAVVVLLGLAGGVSLGPENPIIAINGALAVALLARLWKQIPTELAMMLAVSGTIGALFGTPVAAALVFTGIVGAARTGGALWDRLFLPLVAAGAGAITMRLLGVPSMALDLPAYGEPRAVDLLTGTVVAAATAALALVAVVIFPHVHRALHRLGNPLIYIGLGGVILGILGAIGGPLTLFKGLHQMAELVETRDDYDGAQLAMMALVKIAALVIAAASGFRGGRIFPAVFIGVALGLLGATLIPDLPISLSVACAVMAVTLVVARDGWIALFVGVMVSGDVTVLPVLCLIILPIWLMVTRAPEMVVHVTERPSGSL